jgi:hypothetical protein
LWTEIATMDYIHLAMTAFFYTVASLLVIAINEVKKQSHAAKYTHNNEITKPRRGS